MKKIDWDKRIRRAAELAERYPSAAEILTFYKDILIFQQTLWAQVSPSGEANAGTSFREGMSVDLATRQLPAWLSLVRRNGPARLASQAEELSRQSGEQQRHMLRSFLSSGDSEEASDAFFARVLFQPLAEAKAAALSPPATDSSRSTCPICDARPQLAVLRPEGDGGKRFLLCSFCITEWEYRRILCPYCGETDHQKLPRYSAEEFLAVRVEACETCKHYLKSVDMTTDGLAVPLVDEVAAAPLDIWALEHGFNKIVPNLMGF